MDNHALLDLLEQLRNQEITVETAVTHLRDLPFHDLGFAKVDHHRSIRKGAPEVIFCQNKSPDQVVSIVKQQISRNETVFGTRASEAVQEAVRRELPPVEINARARCFFCKSPHWRPAEDAIGTIVIASAGTADGAVAEEALLTIELLGHPCTMLYDVGVAGIHRLFAYRKELFSASVIIAIAGMEGALPSVIAGMAPCPVIGVPTSIGYGSHLNGLVPLFAMLNSCASGMTVVNVDNGFGAGFAAVMMNRKREMRPAP
jgi:hypothetical protein